MAGRQAQPSPDLASQEIPLSEKPSPPSPPQASSAAARPLDHMLRAGVSSNERIKIGQRAAADSTVIGHGPALVPGWTVRCGIRQEQVNTLRCEGCCALDRWSSVARDSVRQSCPVWQAWREARQRHKGMARPPLPAPTGDEKT